jgi:hypothetical protein
MRKDFHAPFLLAGVALVASAAMIAPDNLPFLKAHPAIH